MCYVRQSISYLFSITLNHYRLTLLVGTMVLSILLFANIFHNLLWFSAFVPQLIPQILASGRVAINPTVTSL